VSAHLGLLDSAAVDYRLAPPGARIVNGRLQANTEFPGTKIEYRVGQDQWRPYTKPVSVKGPAELRTRTPDGRRASRTIRVMPSR
jgi:hexosaminidase